MTNWNFFAFDHDRFTKQVATPIRSALTSRSSTLWASVVKELGTVYPHSKMGSRSVYGSEHPVTAVNWYSGRPDLPQDSLPDLSSPSVDTLLKQALEALATYRLVGNWPKPSAVFSELGYPRSLTREDERNEFKAWSGSLFHYYGPQPDPYEFLTRTNQHAVVILAGDVRRLVDIERASGLMRRLQTDLLATEWKHFARDVGSLIPFMELAAHEDLAIYYREDGT